MTINLNVKRIPNRGLHHEYPALLNTETKSVYVDTTLGQARLHEHDANGENIHGDFVGYNIPGAWHTFNGYEPDCPLKHHVHFHLVEELLPLPALTLVDTNLGSVS